MECPGHETRAFWIPRLAPHPHALSCRTLLSRAQGIQFEGNKLNDKKVADGVGDPVPIEDSGRMRI
jgi:hypothetical protein